MRDMTKILPVGTRVMVTPFPPSELEPFIGEITGNDIVTIKAGQPVGWYWVTDEMGREHEVLPSIIEVATEVIVKGYNDDTADTRWCPDCLADRRVVREYTTLQQFDPTVAYVLECGHHTIDL